MPGGLDSFKEMLAQISFGNSRQESIKNSTCVKCKTIVDPEVDFKTVSGKREFSISQLCNKCQSEVFK